MSCLISELNYKMGYKEERIKNIKKLHKEQELKERLLHYKQEKYILKKLDLKSLKGWETDLLWEIHELNNDLKEIKSEI